MAIDLVNGYVCQNCTDVEYAQKGIDPADPKGTHKAEKAAEQGKTQKTGAAGDPSDPGTAAGQASGPQPADGVNRPVAQGNRGTIINLVT